MAITYVGGITGTALGSTISNGVFDSYPESNYAGSGHMVYAGNQSYKGQSFQPSTTAILSNCQFYLQWADSVLSGNLYAYIYNATGTHGTDAKPTGSPIATSDVVDASTVAGTMSLINFNFSNRIELSSSSTYVVVLYYDGGDATHRLFIGLDITSPSHAGNSSYSIAGTTWYHYTTNDLIFYVNYITNPAITLDLTSLTGGSNSSPSLNDVIVVSIASASVADRSLNVISLGYTKVTELYANDTYDTNLSVYYKLITGSVDTQILIEPSGATTDGITTTAHVFRGVSVTNILDVTSTTATGINGGEPTPPAITPTTAGTEIVCVGACSLNSVPSDFTTATLSNFLTTSANDTYDSRIGSGTYSWTSGTYTPATFGGGTTSTSASWCAVTLALRIGTQAINFTADTTSFTLTGVSNILSWGRKIIADIGTFTLTGISNVISRAIKTISTVGTFTLTGISNSFRLGRNMVASTGSFILTGIGALLIRVGGFIMVASTGVFNLTGIDNILRIALNMINSSVGFLTNLFSLSANLTYGRKIIADVGAFTLTGISNILSKGISMIASVGTFTLTGISNAFYKAIKIIAEVGNFMVTGYGIMFKGSGAWKVRNLAKNISSWIDGIKHSSTASNTTKNNSTVINQNKNTASITNINKNSSSWVNQNK